MSKITVVTACHNSARFIGDTVDSVKSQELADWEHILVDDGSSDGTPGLLEDFSRRDSRIKVLRQENAGTCKARNAGASACSANTKYLFFLDHDDMLEPNALRVLSEYLDAHSEVCVAASQFQEIDAGGRQIGAKIRSRWVPSVLGLPRPLRPHEYETPFVTFYCCTGQGPFAMFRRSVFEEAGGWTTAFWPHEDTDLFCKMALLGKVHYLPDRLYRKRVHQDNALNNSARLIEAYELFRKKWDSYEPRNPAEAATISAAAIFYRASFKPLRHIKVGTKALGEFVRNADPGKLRWALQLFGWALRDFVHYRIGSGKTHAVAPAERILE